MCKVNILSAYQYLPSPPCWSRRALSWQGEAPGRRSLACYSLFNLNRKHVFPILEVLPSFFGFPPPKCEGYLSLERKSAAHTCHSSEWQCQLTPQRLGGQAEDKPVYWVHAAEGLTKASRWGWGGTGGGVKEFRARRGDLHAGITAQGSSGAARSSPRPRALRLPWEPGAPRADLPSRSFWIVHQRSGPLRPRGAAQGGGPRRGSRADRGGRSLLPKFQESAGGPRGCVRAGALAGGRAAPGPLGGPRRAAAARGPRAVPPPPGAGPPPALPPPGGPRGAQVRRPHPRPRAGLARLPGGRGRAAPGSPRVRETLPPRREFAARSAGGRRASPPRRRGPRPHAWLLSSPSFPLISLSLSLSSSFFCSFFFPP